MVQVLKELEAIFAPGLSGQLRLSAAAQLLNHPLKLNSRKASFLLVKGAWTPSVIT